MSKQQEAERLESIRRETERKKARHDTVISDALRAASCENTQSSLESKVTSRIPDGWRDVTSLGYIVHVDNIASILEHGILSYVAAERYPHESLADDDVQARRTSQIPGTGFSIHECAIAFINPRNAMLYRLTRSEPLTTLAVVRLNAPSVFSLPYAQVSTQNAATDGVEFHSSPAGLSRLQRDQVFADRWYVNGVTYELRKKRMQAEVLVPGAIPVSSIVGIAAPTSSISARLQGRYPDQDISVDGRLFFQ